MSGFIFKPVSFALCSIFLLFSNCFYFLWKNNCKHPKLIKAGKTWCYPFAFLLGIPKCLNSANQLVKSIHISCHYCSVVKVYNIRSNLSAFLRTTPFGFLITHNFCLPQHKFFLSLRSSPRRARNGLTQK